MTELELRPEVLWFAQQMEQKLRENDHKGSWLGIGMDYAQRRMREEALELEHAIVGFSYHDEKGNLRSDDEVNSLRQGIIREAADVANFAMMIATEWNPRGSCAFEPSVATGPATAVVVEET